MTPLLQGVAPQGGAPHLEAAPSVTLTRGGVLWLALPEGETRTV